MDCCNPGGVVNQSIWNYCQYRKLMVRRIDDPTVPRMNVHDIAKEAAHRVGEPYNVVEAILARLGWAQLPNPDALYCSTFVGLVVAKTTGINLASDPAYRPLYPGALASHPDLIDVGLEWRHF